MGSRYHNVVLARVELVTVSKNGITERLTMVKTGGMFLQRASLSLFHGEIHRCILIIQRCDNCDMLIQRPRRNPIHAVPNHTHAPLVLPGSASFHLCKQRVLSFHFSHDCNIRNENSRYLQVEGFRGEVRFVNLLKSGVPAISSPPLGPCCFINSTCASLANFLSTSFTLPTHLFYCQISFATSCPVHVVKLV